MINLKDVNFNDITTDLIDSMISPHVSEPTLNETEANRLKAASNYLNVDALCDLDDIMRSYPKYYGDSDTIFINIKRFIAPIIKKRLISTTTSEVDQDFEKKVRFYLSTIDDYETIKMSTNELVSFLKDVDTKSLSSELYNTLLNEFVVLCQRDENINKYHSLDSTDKDNEIRIEKNDGYSKIIDGIHNRFKLFGETEKNN